MIMKLLVTFLQVSVFGFAVIGFFFTVSEIYCSYQEWKTRKEFEKRQKRYRKMI